MSESEKSSEYFETNGLKVYFEKFGTGPNVVLLIPGPIGISKINITIRDGQGVFLVPYVVEVWSLKEKFSRIQQVN